VHPARGGTRANVRANPNFSVTTYDMLVANLLADVLYGYLDPRIRLS
jgi:hypothetical protein